jgi:LmbE family N-acetylglucosaminyl deacetylase
MNFKKIKNKLSRHLKKCGCYDSVRNIELEFLKIKETIAFIVGIIIFAVPDLFLYNKVIKQKAKKIIIISHPDDELLFFSQELLHGQEKDLIVFCLSNGYNPTRRREFYRALNYYGVNGYIMKLPDQTFFSFLYNDKTVIKRLCKLRKAYVSCNAVYTHNFEGEYGHRHHQITSRNVVKVFEDFKLFVPVALDKINDSIYLLKSQDLIKKRYVFETFYKSQANGVENYLSVWFNHERSTGFHLWESRQ